MTTCPHFTESRATLFDQIVPNFKKLTKQRQLDILVFGYEPNEPEMKKKTMEKLGF